MPDLLNTALTLVHGTFFEGLLCISIGFEMLKFVEYLKPDDKFSIGWQIVLFIGLFIFILFILYFTIRIIPKIVVLHDAKVAEKNAELRDTVKAAYKDKLKSSSVRISRSVTLLRLKSF